MREFSRFLTVGVLNTIVGYGSYSVLLAVKFHYLTAMITSHIIGMIHSYFWNKHWTFKKKAKSSGEKIRFITVYGIVLFSNAALLILLVDYLKLSAYLGGFLAMILVTVISFIGHKFWSFR